MLNYTNAVNAVKFAIRSRSMCDFQSEYRCDQIDVRG